MPRQFHVTYDVTTNESAEHGDIADHGFVSPGGWLESMTDAPCGPAFAPIKDQHAISLHDALYMLGCLQDGGDGLSYYETDGRDDYQTGDHERRAFHLPDNTTPASINRIQRVLRANGLLLH